MDSVIQKKFSEAKKLVGGTPMVQIEYRYKKGSVRKLYFKLEYYNFSGSIKDRIALFILENAYKHNLIDRDYVVAETTSGSTGISFCAVGKYLGHEVNIFMPDWMNEERKSIVRAFGANLVLVSAEEGGYNGCFAAMKKLKECRKVFTPMQFDNTDNSLCHMLTTGPEIAKQLSSFGKVCDAFVAGVGTGGTVMGIGEYLKSINPLAKIFPLEPLSCPILSKGCRGKHRIHGLASDFVPSILRRDRLDEVVTADDGDAIIMAQMLGRHLGLGVGISSGANFVGAVKAQNMLGDDAVVTSIFCDDNKKYLSTDLMRDEPVKDYFISKDIELLDFSVVR